MCDSSDLGETLAPSSVSSENLEGLTENVGNLGLRVSIKNRSGAAKSGQGRLTLRGFLLGILAAANLGPLQAVRHRHCRRPVHLGFDMVVDLVRLE
jgi:hypothetical protein